MKNSSPFSKIAPSATDGEASSQFTMCQSSEPYGILQEMWTD